MKLSSITILVLYVLSFFAFTSSESCATEPIKIGVSLPLTGQNGFGGQLELNGIKLAHKLTPKILNREVELIVADNKSNKKEAANAVKKLIEKDKVIAYIGSYGSSLALAGAKVGEVAHIPGIGTSCTTPAVTENKKYFFRACFIDSLQSVAAASYAYNQLNMKKAAVLMDASNSYSTELSKYFIRHFTKLGGQIVGVQKYNSGDENFSKQLSLLKKVAPQILFLPAYFSDGSLIIQQARGLDCTFAIMGTDAMDNPDTLKLGEKAVEGFFHTTFPYDLTMPSMSDAAKMFTNRWKAEYTTQDPNANAALGYICYQLLMEAINRGNSATPQDITNSLTQIQNFSTPLGSLSIDEQHNATLPVGVIKYHDGKRIYAGNVDPE